MNVAHDRHFIVRNDAPPQPSEAVRLLRELAQAFEQQILAAEAYAGESTDTRPSLRQLESQLVHLSRVSTLGTLAASIAHEISQPLTAIQVETYAIQRWMRRETPNTAEIEEGIRRIQAESGRADRVIRSLRALIRSTPATCRPFELDATFADVLPLIEARLQEACISADFTIEPNLPPLFGDCVQIQQVLLNLLINAMDATKDCILGAARIELSAHRRGCHQVAVTVADNGIGIAPAHLDRIFQPFFSTKTCGMGVGLAICRLVVDAHGGTIHAASARGRTEFTVLLPFAPDAAND